MSQRLEEVALVALSAAVLAAFAEIFLAELLLGQPRPGFLLLAAVAVGLARSPVEGALVAFGGGLLLDALAGPPLGRQSLALVVATVVVFIRYTEPARRTVLAPVLAVGVGTVLYWTVLGLADSIAGLAVPWAPVLLRYALPSLVLNVLLAWPAFRLAQRLSVRSGPRLTAR